MSDEVDRNNGDMEFDLDAITNMIVPFEFAFEGRKLKGHWYKYKTTTPQWAAEKNRRFAERMERFVELKKTLVSTKDTTLLLKTQKEIHEIEDQAQRDQYLWLADAIVDWTATRKGEPIPVDEIRTKGFPLPFMVALGQHLEKDRAGENPTSSDSSNGS